MITLYTFGPAFGLPDLSPFVIKAHVLLKMAGQPYQTNSKGYRQSPKGKLPYIDDEGTIVADSTFIRWHLERKHGIDLDQGLSAEQRATAWAVEKMIEDNLYWLNVHWRWMDDANYAKFEPVLLKPVPALLRGVLSKMIRGRARKTLHAQGSGRYSEAERLAIAHRGVQALSTLLGDKSYLMGEQPCGADAMFFASMTSALCLHFKTPLQPTFASEFPNLVAYEARMRERYFSEGASCTPQACRPSMQTRQSISG